MHWDLNAEMAGTETAKTTILEITNWLRLQFYFITASWQLQGPFQLLETKTYQNQKPGSPKQPQKLSSYFSILYIDIIFTQIYTYKNLKENFLYPAISTQYNNTYKSL